MSIFAIFVFFGGAEVAPIYYNKIACYGEFSLGHKVETVTRSDLL